VEYSDKILISDACALFDLIDLELLEYFFQLNYDIYTTIMVVGEIINPDQRKIISEHIEKGSLRIDDSGTLDEINNIFDTHPGLSYTDCSILELAIRINADIISSDKGLRNEAKRRNLAARGILWILNILLEKEIISRDFALEKLKIYPKINKRAPISEIEYLIHKLEQK
jgi:hypothetical protein